MDSQKKIICRLCFEIQDDLRNFKAIEGDMENILDKVLQKMDLAAIQNPVMCTNCADNLMKCFDFKVKCINTSEYIDPFVKKDTVKLDPVDVYTNKNENGTGVLEVQDLCGLCMTPLKNRSVLSINVEGDIALQKVIKQCVPELEMNIIEKAIICVPCHGSLENYYHFLTNSLMVEENIKKYRESQDTESNGELDLNRLLQFATTDVGGSSTDLIKVENQFSEKIGSTDETKINNAGGDLFKFEQVFCDDRIHTKEEFDLKRESFMDMDEHKVNSEKHFISKNLLACKEDVIKMEEPFCGENGLKEENLIGTEDQKFLLNEEAEITTEESNINRFEDGKDKSYLKKHLLMQKDSSEVTMYRCDCCSFETKRKHNLSRHYLMHKDPSDVPLYKCDDCLYETKQKSNLKIHLLMHNKHPTYKCDLCSFATIYKKGLASHLELHKDSSEATMYKCDSCSFHTKHKYNLKRHLLKHKDLSEVTMYKCDSCSFETIYKGSLESHFLKHKDLSEVTIYKCDYCSFETKHKSYIRRHLLQHRVVTEIPMHKCDRCSYQTNDKANVNRHSRKHRDPSEVTMYRCDSCSFQTKRKDDIKRHLLKHMDTSEVTMYKCDCCSYQAKRKDYLKRHLLKHKHTSK